MWRTVTFLSSLSGELQLHCLARLLLARVAQKFTFGNGGSSADSHDILVCWSGREYSISSLCVDRAENIPFHATCEMAVRKWNSHISLPKACHFRRYLQELNDLLLFFLTSPHLWSIKELGIQTPTIWLFWDIILPRHPLGQPAFWMKLYSLPYHLVSQTRPIVQRAEQAWTLFNSRTLVSRNGPQSFRDCSHGCPENGVSLSLSSKQTSFTLMIEADVLYMFTSCSGSHKIQVEPCMSQNDFPIPQCVKISSIKGNFQDFLN